MATGSGRLAIQRMNTKWIAATSRATIMTSAMGRSQFIAAGSVAAAVRGDRRGSLNTLAAAGRSLDPGNQQIQCCDDRGPVTGEISDGGAELSGRDAGELRCGQ
jgi:hypothetical protein